MRQKRREAEHLCSWEGRDEMNLAEFPIASLSSRPSKDLKTLHYEDRVWDKSRNCWTSRELTISASEQYGLPTALDDEVVLGLIQLSREDDFQSRRVFFSRYKLIRLLGWRNEGKSYARLDTSLKRWMGVTLYYENAWWDKQKQSWVDESFHILERLSIYDRQQQCRAAFGNEPALSMFLWNEVVFRSFQAGNLKQIDMELFRQLNSPIAKRLYRLLDKRFYHKHGWHIDLRKLACEHVGLSRNYDASGLKRKLRPAIAELESLGYLKPIEPDDRFKRVGPGRWEVALALASQRRSNSQHRKATTSLEINLLDCGVNPTTARQLTLNHTAEEITRRIEVVRWLVAQGSHLTPRDPAGYLVQSIRDGYELPKDFLKLHERTAAIEKVPRPEGSQTACLRGKEKADEERLNAIDRYLKSLTPEERTLLEQESIAMAEPFKASLYHQASKQGNQTLVNVYRRAIVVNHVSQMWKSKQRRNDPEQ